jgi:ABC-type lipoprotein release transport system permease subunit
VTKSFPTAFFIALRYIFSKKKHNIINIISIVSVLGIMASTAALIIVLSVVNGMQDLVVNNYNRFNPPLIIEAKVGKVFSLENNLFSITDLENIEGIKTVEPVLCDLALATYYEKQTLVTLYGVSENYPLLSDLTEMIVDGNFNTDSQKSIAFGVGIAGLLGVELNDFTPVKLYYPVRNKKNITNPMDAFRVCYAPPTCVFRSNTQYDGQSAFVSLSLAKELFDYENEISFLAIYLDENTSIEKVQKKINQIVGEKFNVLNQIQQETLLFKTIQAENLIIFLILGFIIVIATFNIVGILVMLIIEKKQDISILHTLGASKALLKKVFLMVGAMIGIFGGTFGVCIGLIFCLLQQHFGIISFGNENSSFIISTYPIVVSFKDLMATFFLIILISLITSSLSLRGLNNHYLKNKY